MKTLIVLTLLIATVFCLPVKHSASSSESSEELVAVQQPPILRKAAANMFEAEPTQTTPADSNESTDSADDTEEADEESETDENKEENVTDSSESESGETTAVPSTVEPSLDPIINTGRGDSMGYPSDYKKTIVYVDANDFEKRPSPYKSYSSEKLGGLTFVSKKTSAYDDQSINDVEKEIKLYKALQVHDTPLEEEEDTSTPEVENMEPSDRQVALGSQEIVSVGNQESDSEGASAGDAPADSASASASQEENEEESDSSPSSEDTTATPGAADSDEDSSQSTESQESDSDEVATQTTEASIVTAK